MASRTCLVIDCGAGSGRAILARFDGARFTLEEVHRFDNTPVPAAGTLYWDVLRLFSEIGTGIRKAHESAPDLASLGVDTWGVDFGLLDARGKLLANPVHYRDARRNAEEAVVERLLPRHELFRRTGAMILSIMSVYSLAALHRDGAPELAAARRLLMMPDLLHYFLTGEQVNEYSDACTTAVFDQQARRWHAPTLEALGIPAGIFGAPVLPGTRIGALSPSVRESFGVPGVTVVAPATHDTASAVAGIPARASDPAWAYVSIGTWGVVGMETGAPVMDERLFDAGWGNAGGVEGRSFLSANVTGLWILQQCRQAWRRELGGDLSWGEIVRAAEAAPAFGALIDVDDPVFSPVSADEPGVIAAWCRAHGVPAPEGIGPIARCVYESLVLKFRARLAKLAALTGTRFGLVRMVGGGTQCAPLCQWTADAAGIPVEAGPVETTVAGNLVAQLMGLGEIRGVEQGRALVAASSPTCRYEPRGGGAWEQAAARLGALL